jgi:hypothetical protein
MGNSNSSKRQQQDKIESEKIYNKAVKIFNDRLKNYNPMLHGNYYYYLQCIQAQFELDCIPEYLRHGPNSTRKNYDDYY